MSSSFTFIVRYSDGKVKSYTPWASELEGMLFSKWFYDKDETAFRRFCKVLSDNGSDSKLLSPDSSYGIAVIDFVTNTVHECQCAAQIGYLGSASFSLALNHNMDDPYDLEYLIEKNIFSDIRTPSLKKISFDTRSMKEWKKRTLKGSFLIMLDKPFKFHRYNPEIKEQALKMYEWMQKEGFALKKIDHDNWKLFLDRDEDF